MGALILSSLALSTAEKSDPWIYRLGWGTNLCMGRVNLVLHGHPTENSVAVPAPHSVLTVNSLAHRSGQHAPFSRSK
jgi:hypothetical protein